MKKIIVTTTINPPTEALKKFSEIDDWHLVVVPDLKTPHQQYKNFNCTYISIEEQKEKYKTISEYIGWNKTERRNIGYIKAYEMGADIIATVDDDNIPYSNWGKNVFLNQEIEVDTYENIYGCFDPLSVTNKSYLWHRGFPLQLINNRHENVYLGKIKQKFLIQADLWNGEPDIDAIYRLTHKYANENFNISNPFTSTNISPFNSQNTFIHRSIIKHYMMPVDIGRVQDIWGAYLVQKITGAKVLYAAPTVFQKRNDHIILNDYLQEIKTYHLSLDLINNNLCDEINKKILEGLSIYQSYFI